MNQTPLFLSDFVKNLSSDTIFSLYKDLKSWSDEKLFLESVDGFDTIDELMRSYIEEVLWIQVSNYMGIILGDRVTNILDLEPIKNKKNKK